MFYSPQREAVITHAVSQILGRWLAVPTVSLLEAPRSCEDFSLLSIADWFRYIEDQVLEESASPWVSVLQKEKLSPIGLATVIFDNLREVKLAGATGAEAVPSATSMRANVFIEPTPLLV